MFTKKQLILDMQWYAFQTRGEVSKRERLSPVYTSRPRLAMFPGCPFLYWTYWVVQIRDPLNNQGLEIMDYFSTFGTRLGVPTMLLLQVDPKWRRLKFWMEVVCFFPGWCENHWKKPGLTWCTSRFTNISWLETSHYQEDAGFSSRRCVSLLEW